ncbi:ABC transporter permease subunit [Clostridium guangxiense]|uniref:ABC transporter permease subunit n=1 Tax=Clostridium guangxiense TaxID=1662055 RepID=UPI001E48CE28|nr:ABC transporter permease subunit [Clostridium guangxiense]MCD2348996.1 ABC transporter permease subunit [Clostridium guangxiense]
MHKLIKNEFIKLHYRKKFVITIIIFALICGLFSFAYSKVQKYSTPDAQISILNKSKTQLQNEKDSTSDSTKKEQLEQSISGIDSQIDQLKTSKASTSSKNWKASLKNQIDSLKDQKNSATDISSDNAKETYNKQIIFYQYFIDHNIKPQANGSFSAFNFLDSLFKLLGSLFIPIIIAILSADIVSGEYTPPTMKMLLTRPASRSKILISKFVAILASSIIIITVIELVSYLIMGIIYGFDNPMYPVLVGTKYTSSAIKLSQDSTGLIPVLGSSYIIATWKFIIQMFLFQLLYILACCSLFILFSTILRSSTLSMTLSILATIVVNILSSISYLAKATPFFFSTYGSISSILDSSIIQSTGVTYITPLFGCIFLIVFSAICYSISAYVFHKKDINI